MSDLPPGFPKFKGPKKAKSGFIKPMSDKTRAKMPERKEIIEKTHKRDKVCVAKKYGGCKGRLEVDEKQGRGREPGSQYDLEKTQLLCENHHRFKTQNPKAASMLGLYGEKGLIKYPCETKEDKQWALNEMNRFLK